MATKYIREETLVSLSICLTTGVKDPDEEHVAALCDVGHNLQVYKV